MVTGRRYHTGMERSRRRDVEGDDSRECYIDSGFEHSRWDSVVVQTDVLAYELPSLRA